MAGPKPAALPLGDGPLGLAGALTRAEILSSHRDLPDVKHPLQGLSRHDGEEDVRGLAAPGADFLS